MVSYRRPTRARTACQEEKKEPWKVPKSNFPRSKSTTVCTVSVMCVFETGRLAKQAAGSVLVTIDDETTLLSATAVGKSPREGFDFFPLTVDVEERM